MKFVLFRHGHSLANQESRIVSSLENGTRTTGGPEGTGFGLSSKGKQEVEESAQSLSEHIVASLLPGRRVQIRILASPFRRTRDTALIINHVLRKSVNKIHHERGPEAESSVQMEGNEPEEVQDLRERFFGEFEMKSPSDELYAQVWREDAYNAFHQKFGVESVADVTERMTGVVREQEAKEQKQRVNASRATSQDATTTPATATAETTQSETWVIIVSHGDSLQILQTAMRGWSGDRHRQIEHLNTAEWRIVEWCKELAGAHQSGHS
ncbi:MAG: histidine phosphatase superfamily [Benniella sp.]|nr:MAG: histidine phosphatase superfamily [Benniella sp.]